MSWEREKKAMDLLEWLVRTATTVRVPFLADNQSSIVEHDRPNVALIPAGLVEQARKFLVSENARHD